MSRYISRLSKDVQRETYKMHIRIVSVSYLTPDDLYGIYIKIKRGKKRINGQNRYAIYKDSKNVEISEIFEQTSVFYKNQHTQKYQPKMVVIKLKQESVQSKKDKVLGRVRFDASSFVGKKNLITELSFVSNTSKDARITLETSVLQEMKQDLDVKDQLYQDLFFNDSSSNSEDEHSRGTAPMTRQKTYSETIQQIKAKKLYSSEDVQLMTLQNEDMKKVQIILEEQVERLNNRKNDMENQFEQYMESQQLYQTKIENQMERLQRNEFSERDCEVNDSQLAQMRRRLQILEQIEQMRKQEELEEIERQEINRQLHQEKQKLELEETENEKLKIKLNALSQELATQKLKLE